MKEEKDLTINNDNLDLLILGVAQGNEEKFAELYKQTSTSIYSYALSFVKNRYDAEDIMHDCYIKVYNCAAEYRSQGKPMAWMITITKNLCLQKIKDAKKLDPLDFESLDMESEGNTSLNIEDKVLIESCINSLSPEESQILILHVVVGFKHREIAEELNLPISTVLSKYNRAVKKLKNKFAEDCN